MKVIHLISGGDSGGARTHVHLLLKHLNQDMEARLVCFMDGPFARDAQALGIPTLVVEKEFFAALKQLRALIREDGYDIIHCHGSRGNLMGAILGRLCGVPVVSTVHSDPKIDYMGRPWARLSYGSLNAIALRRMDFLIGVSDAMRELLISRRFPPSRIFAIYNGIEFEDFPERSAAERRAFFARVGLDADENSVVVGIAARFHPVKDLPTLLRGFALAREKHPELRLLIAGDGEERENLLALARELGIERVCCFAGWLEDADEFYRCIDINTLTSLSETFPYALTEGSRAKLPTVASRVGGVPRLIRHGENGLLFEPGDAQALAGHLAALAESPEMRERLGQALYERASRDFSAAATAEKQKEIYRRILDVRAAEKAGERRGVLICGAYGMSNAGDEAILEAILKEMRSIDPEMPATVLTRTPRATALKHGVDAVHTFRFPKFLPLFRRCRLYINGGGSLIQDVTSSRSLWYYLFTLRAAKKRGCRVMMYGCGIGPVSKKLNRRLSGLVIDRYVDAITLREENSLDELRSFGVTRPLVEVASDPALSLVPADAREIDGALERFGLEKDGRYLCVCLRNWPGFAARAEDFARAADYAWERYGLKTVFLPVNYKKDGQIAEAVAERMHSPAVIVRELMPTPLVVGFLSRMSAVLSMRLHGLIFAASQGVPLAGVSYDPKVAAFLDYIGQSNYVDFRDADEARLRALIDRAATADPAEQRAGTERIRAIESRNVEMARRLLAP
ncbi:MAG: polysaccharide pyruvyl transferase CsaB [Oscillospiraceae bacterium]